jgi:HAMP domain-containing protein
VIQSEDSVKETLLHALKRHQQGDFSVRIEEEWEGVDKEIADAFNSIVEINQTLATDLTNASAGVVNEGNLSQRLVTSDFTGDWQSYTNSVNTIIESVAQPTAQVMEVISAVANGNLSYSMDLENLRGQYLEMAQEINRMLQNLNSFTLEVTRVIQDVGIEGKLGGKARVNQLKGTWKDLTDDVNVMATNLTGQVRAIAEVTTAVANGDLSKKIEVDVKGEILELKNTINTMVDQLSTFAAEVFL